METRTSGFLLALTATLVCYFLVMAGFLEAGATTPADHAAAKLVGVLAGALALVWAFLFGRRMLAGDPSHLPGYVPPAQDRDRT
ncbi:MAG TPA: hypothetical protein VD864_00020 [Nocardioides sp.]|nr:hypothetical protein [Nocardioides sp.]